MSTGNNNRGPVNLKEAASLLTKGGTLINDPCPLCMGVQVRFNEKLVCIGCGRGMAVNETAGLIQKEQENRETTIVETYKDVALDDQNLSDQLEKFSMQDKQTSIRGSKQIEAPLYGKKSDESHSNYRHRTNLGFQNIVLLLIDRIASELSRIKENENQDSLKQKAETIRAFLELLQKVREIERR